MLVTPQFKLTASDSGSAIPPQPSAGHACSKEPNVFDLSIISIDLTHWEVDQRRPIWVVVFILVVVLVLLRHETSLSCSLY
jgi:hypothetical protein